MKQEEKKQRKREGEGKKRNDIKIGREVKRRKRQS